MIFRKFIRIVFSMLSLLAIVSSHDSRKHEHYSFQDLREEVNGDSLTSEDQQRLFNSLHFYTNCSEVNPIPDHRKCFTPKDLHDFEGSPPSKALNSTEFIEISPVIVFCLLPTLEKNHGQTECDLYPKNHSELFNVFARNFSDANQTTETITHEALDHILEEINKTIGDFLTKKKCFSAESIINEVKEDEHHDDEEGGHHAHEGEHPEEGKEHSKEEKSLDQHDFEKACASIILHLVQGFCIEEGHGHDGTESKLPSRDFFIGDIFNGKTHLSEGDLEEITKSLGIGEASSEGDDHTDHNGHNHRRRRAADLLSQKESVAESRVRHRRAVDDHDHDHGHHSTGTCYSLDDLLTVFDIDHSIGADSYDFQQLCPAFIQQAKSGACKAQTTKKTEEADLGKVWGYGFAAVTIISLTSLVGVATIPFLGKKLYKKILAFLVALAVGTLAGDALLHLLPHAFGLHAHEEEGSEGDSHADHSEESAFVWKALVVLVSIYGFFLFETLMHLGLKSKVGGEHGHSHVNAELPGPSSRHMSFKKERRCSKFEHHEGVPPFDKTEDKEKGAMDNGDIVLANEQATKGDLEDYSSGVPQSASSNRKKSFTSSLSRRSVFSTDGEKKTLKNISAVAWMIIIGDTLHNLSDGLAIGAAFSEGGNSGVSGGISTSIAVFCHELPHELGDFAVLLTAGMSVKMALLANFLSALSCYIGLAIGIYIGQEGEVRFWIFAIAGGMFLYVALVDMLPDLMHSEALQTEPFVTFLMQNFGLLLGFVIMLIIALYEEDLMAIEF
ncbi:metal cation symporter ZIP14-like isoform X2 [Montipora foliosa]|uniref:metal cation symporter ZIP14-like isoform X2 n=1 Tax=Montipora foliosa TaxID=591990 RepID=UPI0035F11275